MVSFKQQVEDKVRELQLLLNQGIDTNSLISQSNAVLREVNEIGDLLQKGGFKQKLDDHLTEITTRLAKVEAAHRAIHANESSELSPMDVSIEIRDLKQLRVEYDKTLREEEQFKQKMDRVRADVQGFLSSADKIIQTHTAQFVAKIAEIRTLMRKLLAQQKSANAAATDFLSAFNSFMQENFSAIGEHKLLTSLLAKLQELDAEKSTIVIVEGKRLHQDILRLVAELSVQKAVAEKTQKIIQDAKPLEKQTITLLKNAGKTPVLLYSELFEKFTAWSARLAELPDKTIALVGAKRRLDSEKQHRAMSVVAFEKKCAELIDEADNLFVQKMSAELQETKIFVEDVLAQKRTFAEQMATLTVSFAEQDERLARTRKELTDLFVERKEDKDKRVTLIVQASRMSSEITKFKQVLIALGMTLTRVEQLDVSFKKLIKLATGSIVAYEKKGSNRKDVELQVSDIHRKTIQVQEWWKKQTSSLQQRIADAIAQVKTLTGLVDEHVAVVQQFVEKVAVASLPASLERAKVVLQTWGKDRREQLRADTITARDIYAEQEGRLAKLLAKAEALAGLN
ncbi:hypothetical protein COV18_06420 [Candidatus Woesearchaeota archaeon CG10_big_fil_rev_8_21_14_0_10_37_12]|nr:MAG: hypothetical protein COV18_06420 [Candidatus Woesearchaeota archaeon CG10_big_fil_rev_8_21_14_0_10_37_12]